MNIIKFINPVQVIKLLKGSDKRNAVKGVLLMGGSGALIPSGMAMITLGAETMDKYQLIGGTVFLCIGAVLAIVLSKQVKEIQNEESTVNK